MVKRQRGRASKYTDEFKRQLVAESRTDGVSVPMVSTRHGVSTSRIYSWRGDARFAANGAEAAGFSPVEVLGQALALPEQDAPFQIGATPSPSIEITLENGRKLAVGDGVDAGFVLELARGLAA